MRCLRMFQCQDTWHANDMVVLLVSLAHHRCPHHQYHYQQEKRHEKLYRLCQYLHCYWGWIQEQCYPCQVSSGQCWGYQKGFRHSSHPVISLLLTRSCEITSTVCPCKVCLNCSTKELWVQEIQHEVGCTCTYKSCRPWYPELPP